MTQIKLEAKVEESRLNTLGVRDWPIWSKEPSEFPWTYDATETCYLLAGKVTVTAADGQTVDFGQGDLVVFPKGLRCTWKIHQAVRKHYDFA